MKKQFDLLIQKQEEQMVRQYEQMEEINSNLAGKVKAFAQLWQQEYHTLEDMVLNSKDTQSSTSKATSTTSLTSTSDEKSGQGPRALEPSPSDGSNEEYTKVSQSSKSNDPPVDFISHHHKSEKADVPSEDEVVVTSVRPPDPPEEVYCVPDKPKRYQLPEAKAIPVVDSKETTLESKAVRRPPAYVTGTIPPPTEATATGATIVYTGNERKLTFPKYLKHYRFHQWKDLCVLACV